eukprot:SAG22_NODE_5_length_41775_cov_111.520971_9_plen_166_part_00
MRCYGAPPSRPPVPTPSPPHAPPHPTELPQPEPEPEVELVPPAGAAGGLELTDVEQAAVLALRRRLPPNGEDGLPSTEMLLRFLRATSFGLDVKHRDPARRGDFFAERLLRRHLAWRQRWRPEQLTARDCRTALDSGAARFLGWGRSATPWCGRSLSPAGTTARA